MLVSEPDIKEFLTNLVRSACAICGCIDVIIPITALKFGNLERRINWRF